MGKERDGREEKGGGRGGDKEEESRALKATLSREVKGNRWP